MADKTMDNGPMADSHQEERKGTKDLFLETLTRLGCQYEIDDEDEANIRFAFQGEFFVVRATNESPFLHIYDTQWEQIDLYDIDEFSRLRKAINESNIANSVITVYTINEAGGTVNVHSKSAILFIPEIPDISDYLRSALGEFFQVHETVRMEMAKQRELEKSHPD